MLPDDPRHGTSAGYVAGCREQCCREPRMRQQKATRLRVHRGIPTYYTAEQVAAVVAPWRAQGIADRSILLAAGLRNDHALKHHRVLASTYAALVNVTEKDFGPKVTVWSELTKRRIFSLMAAGHRLDAMPINSRGAWRDRDRTQVGIARDIRDYYAANEFKIGPSRQTAARARNAGHQPPLAWDDPGTLAWPGLISKDAEVEVILNHEVDPSIVERFLRRDITPGLWANQAEKREIARRWQGSLSELARMTGWKVERYHKRGDAA